LIHQKNVWKPFVLCDKLIDMRKLCYDRTQMWLWDIISNGTVLNQCYEFARY
jgi:hypothetical protein